MKNLYRLLVSFAVSALLIGLLLRLPASSDKIGPADLIRGLRHSLVPFIGVYLLAQLIQALGRAARSIVLLKASCAPSVRIPGLFQMTLVTLARGACADMLPARIGELSYIAMLNRGYRIPAADGFSSLSIGLVFDFLALLAVLLFALPGATQGLPTTRVLLMPALACAAGLCGLYLILPRLARLSDGPGRSPFFRRGPIPALLRFIRETAEAVLTVKDARILWRVLLLSLIIRTAKYTGLYFLFLSVTRPLWPELSHAGLFAVLVALISAEGAASLPIPTFMSFGTYETGGLAALTALGFQPAESLTAMLTMHLLSQIIDYSLGGLAFLPFIWRKADRPIADPTTETKSSRWKPLALLSSACLIAAACILFGALQYHGSLKRGRLRPPRKGTAVEPTTDEITHRNALLPTFHGRIAWSSNRDGLHAIYLATYPEGRIERLTFSERTDTYPRFSPDGERIAFSRSQKPWVSQRDPLHWDTFVIDLGTKQETLVATNAFMAVWSPDGKSILFPYDGGSSIRQALLHPPLSEGRTVIRSGEGAIPPGLRLGIPDVREGDPWLAVTIRGARRRTALVTKDGRLQDVAGGCQLVWRRKDEYGWVDRPGKMKNAIYHGRPGSEPSVLFDSDDDFSHEYFPSFTADGRWLVYGASRGGHEQDSEDYEIFLMDTERPGTPPARLTFHTGNDCWPDIHQDGPPQATLER